MRERGGALAALLLAGCQPAAGPVTQAFALGERRFVIDVTRAGEIHPSLPLDPAEPILDATVVLAPYAQDHQLIGLTLERADSPPVQTPDPPLDRTADWDGPHVLDYAVYVEGTGAYGDFVRLRGRLRTPGARFRVSCLTHRDPPHGDLRAGEWCLPTLRSLALAPRDLPAGRPAAYGSGRIVR